MRFAYVLVAATLICHLAGSVHADVRRDRLGGYERAALDRALSLRSLELESEPAGKVLGRIHVVTQEVFAPGEGLTWLNFLRRTTREHVIERQVLLRPGQMWDEAAIQDSVRRLRDPRFINLAVIVPVKTQQPGQVDILVVTRDVWSLRPNSDYEIQNGQLTRLILAPAETNLLGLQKQLYLLFDLRQGEYSLGASFVDTAIAGSRMRLSARSTAVFGRDDNEIEGNRTFVRLSYPLWSLSRPWGASITFANDDAVERDFVGGALRLRDLSSTPEVEQIPYIFDLRQSRLDSRVTWSRGHAVKHYVTLGHEFAITRPSLYEDTPTPEECGATPLETCIAALRSDVFPRSERSSALYLEYAMFTPVFRTFRNIDTYDLPEERQFGPDIGATLALASTAFGSEQNYVGVIGRFGWTFPLGPNGILRTLARFDTRIDSGDFIDNGVSATLLAISPSLGPWLRLAGRAEVSALLEEKANRYFTLGGDNGLRGFEIGLFSGQKRIRGNLELRSGAFPLLFSRIGGLVFWDFGHAADNFDDLRIQHNVGLGGRMVIPQTQTAAIRLDWAVPLTGEREGFAGSRVILSFAQVFDVVGQSPVPDAPLPLL